ncbi:uncharacterized protein ACA1_181390 [Acanthamoeba castellanii str. Neff]|uniref:Uncharacterized protein n=1 Tax=Acanthamoeba castellanii (strain ATCC 30010 / Neff) TaxID=1257118 RepID=L8H7X9_ACACF|nr:uncharacterized protein ACA1_181390 [Acanthamoeba castellanii str. Neff]ELR21260.1 hypothetical protein ACA1_181390 [Acanthamoeba castellanii str. Neff]
MALTKEEQSLKFDLRQNMDMKMFFLYLSRIKTIKSLWKGLNSSAQQLKRRADEVDAARHDDA